MYTASAALAVTGFNVGEVVDVVCRREVDPGFAPDLEEWGEVELDVECDEEPGLEEGWGEEVGLDEARGLCGDLDGASATATAMTATSTTIAAEVTNAIRLGAGELPA